MQLKTKQNVCFTFPPFLILNIFCLFCLVWLKGQVAICRTGSFRNETKVESHFSRKTLQKGKNRAKKFRKDLLYLENKLFYIIYFIDNCL